MSDGVGLSVVPPPGGRRSGQGRGDAVPCGDAVPAPTPEVGLPSENPNLNDAA